MQRLLNSFRYAFRGLYFYAASEKNVTIHLIATMMVVIAGLYFGISASDWLILIILMAMVHITEALNTAIETIVDLVSPQQHPLAGKAKDLAAGAVLISAIAAVIGGLIIFYPYLMRNF